MIRSGLTNTRNGGGFEKGYPHEIYPQGRDQTIRPFVEKGDPTILKKSAYSTPADYKAITPSPVDYNDIFGKKTTSDERLYILKQIQQGLDKIQKGILGRVPNIPQASAPSATQPSDQIGLPMDGAPDESPDGPDTPPPLTGSTDSDFPGVIDVDGLDDDALLEVEEIAQDVVQPPVYPAAEYDETIRSPIAREFNVPQSASTDFYSAGPGSAVTPGGSPLERLYPNINSPVGPLTAGSPQARTPQGSPQERLFPNVNSPVGPLTASSHDGHTFEAHTPHGLHPHAMFPGTGPFTAVMGSPISSGIMSGHTGVIRDENGVDERFLDLFYRELDGLNYDQQYAYLQAVHPTNREHLAQLAIANPNHPIARLEVFRRNIAALSPGTSAGSTVAASPGSGFRSPPGISAGSSRTASSVSRSASSVATTISSNGVGPRSRSSSRQRSADSRMSVPMSVDTPVIASPPIRSPRQFRRGNAPGAINTSNLPPSSGPQRRRRNDTRAGDSFIPDRTRTTRRNPQTLADVQF